MMEPSAETQHSSARRRQSIAKSLMTNRVVKLVADKMFSPTGTCEDVRIEKRQQSSDVVVTPNLKHALPGLLSNRSLESLTRDIVGADIDCAAVHIDLTKSGSVGGLSSAHSLNDTSDRDVFTFETEQSYEPQSHIIKTPTHVAGPMYNENKVRPRQPARAESRQKRIQRSSSQGVKCSSTRARGESDHDGDEVNRRHSMILTLASNNSNSRKPNRSHSPAAEGRSPNVTATTPPRGPPGAQRNRYKHPYKTSPSHPEPVMHRGLHTRDSDPVPAPRRTVSHCAVSSTRRSSLQTMSPHSSSTAPPKRAAADKSPSEQSPRIVKLIQVKQVDVRHGARMPKEIQSEIPSSGENGIGKNIGSKVHPQHTCDVRGADSTQHPVKTRASAGSKRNVLQHSFSLEARKAPKATPRPDVTTYRHSFFHLETEAETVEEVCEHGSDKETFPANTHFSKGTPRGRHLNSDKRSSTRETEPFRSARPVITVRPLRVLPSGPNSLQKSLTLKATSQPHLNPILQSAPVVSPRPKVLKRALSERSTRPIPGGD